MPTQTKQMALLRHAETASDKSEATATKISGLARWVNTGLQLENDQSVAGSLVSIFVTDFFLRAKVKAFKARDDPQKTIDDARLKGLEKFVKWEKEAIKLFPALEADFNQLHESNKDFESLTIFLPSHWIHSHDRIARGFGKAQTATDQTPTATKTEFVLRYGQAHDALHSLRESIKVWYYGLRFKKIDNFDRDTTTRAMEYVKTLGAARSNHAKKYRRAYSAMLCIGLDANDFSMFQPLEEKDLYMRDPGKTRALGSGGEPDPWFWTVGCPDTNLEDEWSIEGALHY